MRRSSQRLRSGWRRATQRAAGQKGSSKHYRSSSQRATSTQHSYRQILLPDLPSWLQSTRSDSNICQWPAVQKTSIPSQVSCVDAVLIQSLLCTAVLGCSTSLKWYLLPSAPGNPWLSEAFLNVDVQSRLSTTSTSPPSTFLFLTMSISVSGVGLNRGPTRFRKLLSFALGL